VRFIASVWSLILASLLLFTFVIFSHDLVSSGLTPVVLDVAVVGAAWTIGLVSASAIHILYRRTERIVQKATRDETIVQLAGAVAHEMNQPLTVLISSAELMCHHDHSVEEMRAVAQRMMEASQRMADIVEKLQRATHYQSKHYVGDVKIVDLDKAV
jgi:signal transduction histidine kinase